MLQRTKTDSSNPDGHNREGPSFSCSNCYRIYCIPVCHTPRLHVTGVNKPFYPITATNAIEHFVIFLKYVVYR